MLAGTVSLGQTQYFLAVKELKNTDTYYLISKVHHDDLFNVSMGQPAQHVIIQDVQALTDYFTADYLLESRIKYKKTGNVKSYGESNNLGIVFDTLYFAKSYKFSNSSISSNTRKLELGTEIISFSAKDTTLKFDYEISNGSYTRLIIEHGTVKINLGSENIKLNGLSNVKYIDMPLQQKKQVMRATIKTITYSSLRDSLDMSWYKDEETGQYKKDYQHICSIVDFETKIITPIVKEALKLHSVGKALDVSLDTETNGIFIYNLDDNNSIKSHCVAIPISWKEDFGRVIFTDMEHFENIPNEYAWSRLECLFSNFKGEREFEIWEENEADVNQNTKKITSFSSDNADNLCDSQMTCRKTVVTITRDMFNLIGHNIPFDRKVAYLHKHNIWFDNDTLQMSFDIYPTIIKISHKLKSLTRRIFGHETPELSDVLGKGNEDKYRELVDSEVANIYGCADADYTLKLFHYLRGLMSDYMYIRYQQQDVPLLNILAISEYYGLRTIEDKVAELAKETYENIEILKNTMYSYVGVYMDYAQKRAVVDALNEQGAYKSEKEYLEAKNSVVADPNAVYKFEFKASQLREVLYNLMHYPVPAYTDGKDKLPKVDKYAIDKLLKKERTEDNTSRKLTRDILCYGASYEEYLNLKNGTDAEKKKAKSMVLISADEFNSKQYPLALIVKKHSDLNKEYTAYFKPMLENNLEGKMFKGYSMSNIETRRISNPAQTMKGSLKALIRSYADDYYVLDFDMSQVEYRIMLSLAGFIDMIEKMKNPENDYHTETAAMVNAIPPHRVSKKLRKQAKSVSFGVPYGLGERSLCEKMFDVVNEETLFATRLLLHKWKQSNAPIMQLLEEAREMALTPIDVSDEFRNYIDAWKRDEETKEYLLDSDGNKIPTPIGKVTNKFGFSRFFDLSKVDQSKAARERRKSGKYDPAESSIRRMAGNYPIQSFAAEVFRIILIRFYNRCEEEGINDKIIWHMLIHDELLCSVHKSIHPFLIYKIVKESCMITMKGHTKYFVGINIGDTWAECKDDAREAPVLFVERMIKRYEAGEFREQTWFDHPWEFIKPLRAQYVEDRIGEVLRTIQPDIDSAPVNVPLILKKFDNYTVRAYVNDYSTNTPVDKADYGEDMYADAVWSSRLESWALNVYGEGKQWIDILGNVCTLKKYSEIITKQVEEDEFIDVAELFEDSKFEDERFLSFDEDDVEEVYNSVASDMEADEELDDYVIDYSKYKSAKSLADMIVEENPLKNIRVVDDQIIIKANDDERKIVKEYLSANLGTGKLVLFKDSLGRLERWKHISSSISPRDLDSKVQELLEASNKKVDIQKSTEHIRFVNDMLMISVKNARHTAYICEQLENKFICGNSGTIRIMFKNSFGNLERWKKITGPVDVDALEKIVTEWR